MSNRNQSQKPGKSSAATVVIMLAAAFLLLAAVLIMTNKNNGKTAAVAEGSDVVINKSEITNKVTFYPARVGKINMEIMAVKASDGTIRTAFNTCQVCNGSPRAYYKQDGDVIVCQNCGNRFSMDQIEIEKGGCNPIPIFDGDKTDNGDTITISKDFIAQNKGLFTENWKSQ